MHTLLHKQNQNFTDENIGLVRQQVCTEIPSKLKLCNFTKNVGFVVVVVVVLFLCLMLLFLFCMTIISMIFVIVTTI